MRRPTRSGNNDLNATISRFLREICRPVRRPMRRRHINLICDPEIVESLSGLAHDLQIRITPHHNRNPWLAHHFSSKVFSWICHPERRFVRKAKQTAVEGSLPYYAPCILVIPTEGRNLLVPSTSKAA